MARRITRAFITGSPSSEMATAPASFMPPMAASSSPALPLVMAPMGKTLTIALRRARSALDVLGVFEAGFAQMDVHVDETGSDDHAGGVEHLGAGRGKIRRDAGDTAI